ncbi:MAG: ATP-binding protein [Thermodesulfobacteriota bacterium]|nr:ATP-binding protein [Thermodesulfobacteriota bacterium]
MCTHAKKDKNVEKSSLKTVVAFLNTDGGSLLIGVDDGGTITGLQEEMDKFHKKSEDKFLLHFNNLIKDKIGEDFYPFVEYHIVNIDEMKVLFVECKPSTSPCFYNEEFFVRANPATNQLTGPKLINYIKRHFPDEAQG